MCGIHGTTRRSTEDELQRALRRLAHRGPDSSGSERFRLRLSERTLILQHTRLAIQDLSSLGHQPMRSRCGRWWIVFNGEIYNHLELRSDLDVDFRGHSDTETLVEAISAFGLETTLRRINGIYGLAVFDRERETVSIVRDPYGVKPVYYHLDGEGGFSFSSEIRALLPGASRDIDRDALAAFLTLRFTPSPGTLLRGIRRLPPGHVLEFRCADARTREYDFTSPVRRRFSGTLDEAVEAYHARLSEAVERQLLSDVPVGILLSGGVDSALLASLLGGRRDIHAYTVGFEGRMDACEIAEARETARLLGIEHHAVRVDPLTLIDDLPEIIDAIEEPLGTTSVLAMWKLVQLARRDVTVALAGQGSDEPWGGYRRYRIEHLMGRLPFLTGPWLRFVARGLGPWVRDEGLARGLSCLGCRDMAARFRRAYALFDETEIARLLPDARPDAGIAAIERWLEWLHGEADSSAEAMMRIDTKLGLADDLLLYGDKISMAFALELRVPMLDLDLMAFVEGLPMAYRSEYGRTKIVHKLTAERFLPRPIVHRPKKGFLVPFGEWSRGVWRSRVEDHLLASDNPVFDHLHRGSVERLWREHLRGRRDRSRQMFALLTLAVWARTLREGGAGAE